MIRTKSFDLRQAPFGCRALIASAALALAVVLSAEPAFAQSTGGTMWCELSSDTALPGESVTLDVFLEDAVDVQGYQATLAITRTSGVGQVTVSCPGGVTVDEYRPDYIFSALDTVYLEADCANCGVIAPHCGARRVAAARVAGGVGTGATRAHLGTFTLQTAPFETSGSTFEISIAPFPASVVAGADYEPVPFSIGPSCVLTVEGAGVAYPTIPTASEWGLIVLALLLLTAGAIVHRGREPKTPNARGAGAVQGGAGLRALALVLALGGAPSAALALAVVLSAEPAFGQITNGTMTCELSTNDAPPGTSVTLDLFLEDAVDVQGYQATIQITRAWGRGEVTVGCPDGLTVDESRPDFIFSGLDTVYLDPDCLDCGVIVPHCERRQVAAARVTGGADTGETPAYLATFTLEMSADATPGSRYEISIVPFPASVVTGSDYVAIPFLIGPSCILMDDGEDSIPTVSGWGLIVLALLLLTGIKIKFGRRGPKTADIGVAGARRGGSALRALVLVLALAGAPSTALGKECYTDSDCNDNDKCTLDECIGRYCYNTPTKPYGDIAGADGCVPDGVVDEFDVSAIEAGAQGISGPGCLLHNMDINSSVRYQPDGKIDLFDINAVLSAFAGEPGDPCKQKDRDCFESTGRATVTMDVDDPGCEFGFEFDLASAGFDTAEVELDPAPYTTDADINTELLRLELGTRAEIIGDIVIRERDDKASTGLIENVVADVDGTFVSGDSYFDIFVEVELADMGLVLDTNNEALRLEAGSITALPPLGDDYLPPPDAPSVPLYIAGTSD
jgi:hypothetical protein